MEDRTKGSENPGSKSFLRILIGIGTGLRIGRKDLDPFLKNQIFDPILGLMWIPGVNTFIMRAEYMEEADPDIGRGGKGKNRTV